MDSFAATLKGVAQATLESVLLYLPQLLGAIALILLGWILARLLRAATRRGVSLLNALLSRTTGKLRWNLERSGPLVGNVVYWVVLLFFATAATQTLGMQTFTDWLERLLGHLPTLAAGVLIVIAGYVLSGFVASLVQAAAAAHAPAQRTALSRLAQGATLIVALLVGADQIGLKVTWIAIFGAVLVASILGGLTLSVSLGAKAYVANLIGAHYLKQALRHGQRVRVGAHEGRIVEISATSLVLETPDGRVMIPASVYHDQAVTVVARTERTEASDHA